ncbi:MAG: T9SS type A sorting domain-containing protein [Flavobacteriales bacterium]|nr:T9SS type A sorting domain-containing protein [Flavobacteriales bacterium]
MNKNKIALSLPFFDDFSNDSNSVNIVLWEKSSVFINRTYPINPITLGVATFDGLDENGFARNFFQTNPSVPSDTLLSKKIDLSAVDSAYLMFYFQGKGVGDSPQLNDSLVLEFFSNTLVWEQIWFSFGQSMQEFDKVIQIINNPKFLHNAFQFRFRNYATISGNFDHWHIDYVKVNEFLNPNDTIELNDVAFVYAAPSFLERYEQMPWTHFKNNELTEMSDTAAIFLRNNGADNTVFYEYNVYENNNLIAHFPNGISLGHDVLDYDSIGNYNLSPTINSSIFTSLFPDSVTFTVQHIIGTGLNDNKWNDTLYYLQEFNSSFAYDDGVAESAYGINISGAKIAYQFKLNRPDTLRAIQMYFPQMLDSVNHIPFFLTVWENNGGQPGSILHQQKVYPNHTENGKFHYYYLDSIFQMIGTFYVGWEQTTNDLLNIGLDRNKSTNQFMFYNIGSGWTNSSYPGSWMIRPIVSMDEIILTHDEIKMDNFKLYPNPAKQELNIILGTMDNIISIYNLQGKLVKQSLVSTTDYKLNITDLSPGMYVLEVKNNKSRNFQKFIIE